MIPQLNEPMAQHNMLMGRRLYVIDEEREWARRLIDRLGLTGEASSSPTVWQMGLRRLHSRPLSLSLTGVALKTMMLHRPGHLWNFVRSCSGRWWSCSLFPIALPQGSTLEAELISQLSEVALGEGGWSDETAAQCEEKALECGWQSWLWLQILLMNAMYCGGATARWSMVHPKKHTPAQEEVVARQEMLARKWTGQSQPEKKIEVGDWDKLEEGLGGMYTGASLGKSYNP